jgi:hypothetical protein
MQNSKHEWGIFYKGRMKVKACVYCGELHLPSNAAKRCESHTVLDSQIVKAGYKLHVGRV